MESEPSAEEIEINVKSMHVCAVVTVCVSQRHSEISFYEEMKVFPSVSSIPECA